MKWTHIRCLLVMKKKIDYCCVKKMIISRFSKKVWGNILKSLILYWTFQLFYTNIGPKAALWCPCEKSSHTSMTLSVFSEESFLADFCLTVGKLLTGFHEKSILISFSIIHRLIKFLQNLCQNSTKFHSKILITQHNTTQHNLVLWLCVLTAS